MRVYGQTPVDTYRKILYITSKGNTSKDFNKVSVNASGSAQPAPAKNTGGDSAPVFASGSLMEKLESLKAEANSMHDQELTAVSGYNLMAAESRVRDVDMAKEMMDFVKDNILNQAATAMLAQAPKQSAGVLQLLR